jgi:2-dehydro-3-deoxyphosphooctonate aldolase (KDO 8-P synthase)
MARAAASIGVAAIFMETHEDPDTAPSDGPNMIYLDQMPELINLLMQFDALAKSHPLTF